MAKDFGPLALKAVREQMIKLGWVRKYINACIHCVRRMFKWAVANELIPASVYHGLLAVEGLKKGRTEAPEGKPVGPVVADEHVEATQPFLTRPVQAMVQVQRHSGMRPGEVVIMRPRDIDRSGKVWKYRPESHKTEHHGLERIISLGPRAQAALLPFLCRDPEGHRIQ
jgi:integrase